MPDQFVEIVTIGFVTCITTLGREIELIPPREFSFRRQRRAVGFRTADQIAAYRNHGLASLGPQRSDDVHRSSTPVEAAEDRLIDFQRVHQRDDVEGDDRLLTVAWRIGGEESR